MAHQLTKKNRDLLSSEELLTPEQLATSIVTRKQQDSTPPIGKVCVSRGFVAPIDLETVSVKHRRRIPLGGTSGSSRPAHSKRSTNLSRAAEEIKSE
jgi:hypothetical protein